MIKYFVTYGDDDGELVLIKANYDRKECYVREVESLDEDYYQTFSQGFTNYVNSLERRAEEVDATVFMFNDIETAKRKALDILDQSFENEIGALVSEYNRTKDKISLGLDYFEDIE